MAILVKEWDQSFGDSWLANGLGQSEGLEPFSPYGAWPVPVFKVLVVDSKTKQPVGGVQLNTVDADRITPIDADVTDENGIAVLYGGLPAGQIAHQLYFRVVMLPVGYGNPQPQELAYKAVPDTVKGSPWPDQPNNRDVVRRNATIKPIGTITVDLDEKTGKPVGRTVDKSANPKTGYIAFQVYTFNANTREWSPARQDPDTTFRVISAANVAANAAFVKTYPIGIYKGDVDSNKIGGGDWNTARPDAFGRIWVGGMLSGEAGSSGYTTANAPFPRYIEITPFSGGTWRILGQGKEVMTDQGGTARFRRLVSLNTAYPYVYPLYQSLEEGGQIPFQIGISAPAPERIVVPDPRAPSPLPPATPPPPKPKPDTVTVEGGIPDWIWYVLIAGGVIGAGIFLLPILMGQKPVSRAVSPARLPAPVVAGLRRRR